MFPLPGTFEAAVFDMDGLLIDSEPLWGRAEAALVEAHGGRLTRADRLGTIGRSIDDSIAIHAERLGLPPSTLPDLRGELIATVRGLYATEGVIRPGAAELVERLTGRLPLGLASNSDRDLVDLALARIGLVGRFETIVTAADVARPKPAPDAYLELCRRLGADPTRAIGFEDSPSGVAALREAGIVAVGVLAGGPLDLRAADVVVDSLVDVLDWVEGT
jgi:HAD superfamily hydrolase (TIGR01509 family)